MSSINRGIQLKHIKLDLANNKVYIRDQILEIDEKVFSSILVPWLYSYGKVDTSEMIVTRCSDKSNSISKKVEQRIDEKNLSNLENLTIEKQ